MSSTVATPQRLASLDQFRGYTVAGMFLVNFLAEYKGWVPEILHHHNTYCSYADTIMPQFLFAVGFAMRLSFGRRVRIQGLGSGYLRMVRRIMGLLLVSFAIYTGGRVAQSWDQLVDLGAWGAVSPFLKRTWMQTLGQIAVTSLWILPVIRAGAGVRVLFMVGSAVAHVVLSHRFNYDWVNSDPNGIDGGPLGFLTWAIPAILGTLTCDAIVGAQGERPPLARLVLASALVMGLGYVFSCGTRLYDLSPAQRAAIAEQRQTQDAQKRLLNDQIAGLEKQVAEHRESVKRLSDRIAETKRARLRAIVDELLAKPENVGRSRRDVIDEAERQMPPAVPGDPLSKLSDDLVKRRQNDARIVELNGEIASLKAKEQSFRDVKLAPEPVVPRSRIREVWPVRDWKTLLAEPPFVPPPADDPRVDLLPFEMHRHWNYWMMTQRAGSLSYLTFAGGFSILVYVLFYVVSDMWGLRVGVFRTFGANALAAYVLAGIIGTAVKTFIPGDAPAWYVITAFSIDFFLIWLFVRTLEKNNIYLRV